jgi:hypothetical protein
MNDMCFISLLLLCFNSGIFKFFIVTVHVILPKTWLLFLWNIPSDHCCHCLVQNVPLIFEEATNM